MLSFTSSIRLIRNTTWLDPNRNNQSIDHLRSNQGRSQDFSRGAHIFLLSPPSPPTTTTTTTTKAQIFLIPWLKMRLRCKLNRFFCIWNDGCKILCRLIGVIDLKFLSWYLRFLFANDWFFTPFCHFVFAQHIDVMVSYTSTTAKTGRACYLRGIFAHFLYIYHSWVGPKMKHSFVLEKYFQPLSNNQI